MNSTRGATRTDRDTQDAKLNGRYTNTERKGEDKAEPASGKPAGPHGSELYTPI